VEIYIKKTAFRFIENIISEFRIIIAVLLLLSTQNDISLCSRSGVHRVYMYPQLGVCIFMATNSPIRSSPRLRF